MNSRKLKKITRLFVHAMVTTATAAWDIRILSVVWSLKTSMLLPGEYNTLAFRNPLYALLTSTCYYGWSFLTGGSNTIPHLIVIEASLFFTASSDRIRSDFNHEITSSEIWEIIRLPQFLMRCNGMD